MLSHPYHEEEFEGQKKTAQAVVRRLLPRRSNSIRTGLATCPSGCLGWRRVDRGLIQVFPKKPLNRNTCPKACIPESSDPVSGARRCYQQKQNNTQSEEREIRLLFDFHRIFTPVNNRRSDEFDEDGEKLFLPVSRQPILRRLFSRGLLLDVDVGLLEHGLFHAQDKGFGLFAAQAGSDEVPLICRCIIAFR